MTRRPTLTRLIEDARAGGMQVNRVEIMPDGRIVLADAKEEPQSAYEAWAGRREGRSKGAA